MTWLIAPCLIAAPLLVLVARLARGYAIERRRQRIARAHWAAKQELRR